MQRLALFAVLALLFFSGPANSQESAVSASSARSADVPALSPEKSEELRADVLMARKEYAAAIDKYLAILRQRNLPEQESQGGFFGRLFGDFGKSKYPGSAQDRHDDAVLLNKLGVAYQEMGGAQAAESYYKRAMDADAKFATPVNNLGTMEYGQQHYSKAVKYYERALKMGASEATVYSNLGYAYYADKKYELAMQSFNKALALDPSIFDARNGTGGTIMQQRSAPDPAMLNFLLAKAYAKRNDPERTAHYLKLARDYGYKNILAISKDRDFATVIKDPRIQDVLHNVPSYQGQDSKAASN